MTFQFDERQMIQEGLAILLTTDMRVANRTIKFGDRWAARQALAHAVSVLDVADKVAEAY